MTVGWTERVLILAKTYPSPSGQYVETSCVAGITDLGVMRRLYPVPFRMIEEGRQFKKWQWITVRIEKANKDHRPESHRLYIDTITCGETIDTKKAWAERRVWLNKVPAFDSVKAMADARLTRGSSIALLCPKKMLRLEIVEARNAEWTDAEKEKLTREQMQGRLFSDGEIKRQVKELRKVPFDFYYHYACETPEGEKEYRHKIVDWEAGALFWNCRRTHGADWENPFRAKLEKEFFTKDLMLLMGNQHRFQGQWLIISLIYPPKRKPTEGAQGPLF